jgi:hypothetical protein
MRSPFPSIGAVPSRPVSFATMLKAVVRWLINRQAQPPRSEIQLRDRLVDLLAQELDENEPPVETSLAPLKPKRDRRIR